MSPASRFATLAAIAIVLGSVSVAHASWAPDGSLLAPEGGAVIGSDRHGGVFGATRPGLLGRFYHLAASGDAALGWPPDGLELTPGASSATHESISPIAVLPDGQGGSFVLAEEQGPYFGNGGFLDPVQLYLHRRSATGAVARGWEAEGVLVESAWLDHRVAANNLPSMVSDGLGGVVVAWLIGGGSDPNPHALVQRFGSDGSRKWSVDGLDVCGPAAVGTLPTLVADGLGGVFVAWAQWDSSGHSLRVRGQHVLPSGGLAWGPEGKPISIGSFDRMSGALPAMGGSPWVSHARAIAGTPDESGGAILCWTGSSGGDLNIFATRITASGRLPWQQERSVCSARGEQASIVSTQSRRGGVVVVWRDGRDGEDVGIFAQAISRDGRMLWARDGIAVCTGSGDRSQVVAVGDARDGVYVAWVDPPQGGRVFAQHLSESGRRISGSPSNGVLVSNTANSYVGESVALQIVEGARGTAIAAWSSARIGSLAMLLTRRGPATPPAVTGVPTMPADTASVSAAAPSVTFALRGVRPNPVLGSGVVTFALPDAAHATLELVDIAGRRLWSREVGSLGPGEHSVGLGDGSRLPTGIYFVRLSQGARIATARTTILR